MHVLCAPHGGVVYASAETPADRNPAAASPEDGAASETFDSVQNASDAQEAAPPMSLSPKGPEVPAFSVNAPTSDGGVIEVRIPVTAKITDLELAKRLLEVFISNKKAELGEGDSIE